MTDRSPEAHKHSRFPIIFSRFYNHKKTKIRIANSLSHKYHPRQIQVETSRKHLLLVVIKNLNFLRLFCFSSMATYLVMIAKRNHTLRRFLTKKKHSSAQIKTTTDALGSCGPILHIIPIIMKDLANKNNRIWALQKCVEEWELAKGSRRRSKG